MGSLHSKSGTVTLNTGRLETLPVSRTKGRSEEEEALPVSVMTDRLVDVMLGAWAQ